MNIEIRDNVKIGVGTNIGINCKLHNVDIGSYCEIQSDVTIGSASSNQKTILGSNLWIGSNVVIVAGIKIGNCVTISPGSSVTTDVPDYSVVTNGKIESELRYEKNFIDFLERNPWWKKKNASVDSLIGRDQFDSFDIDPTTWNKYVHRECSFLWGIWKKMYGGAKKILKIAPTLPFYVGKRVLPTDLANKYISQLIQSGQPFAVSRFGGTELKNVEAMLNVIENGWNGSRQSNIGRNFQGLVNMSGFFPKDERELPLFTKTIIEASKEIDVLGIWYLSMESYMIYKYMPNVKLTHLLSLEPYLSSYPWSRNLKGKKVLVIHPFDASIKQQYKKRKRLFRNTDVLPEFELITMKAVQTLAGTKDERFSTWFEALEYMTNQALSVNFDIAIIGCGAYGMPLAANLKKAGKQAIHLGGATQLLFGIKGKRWEKGYPSKASTHFNENWIYPEDAEKIKGSEKVENSCYW